MYHHRRFANSKGDECDWELVERARNAVDDEAIIAAIEDTFRSKVGLLNYNHYFLDMDNWFDFMLYSPYDKDGGRRVMERTYRLAETKCSLPSYAEIYTYDSQRDAQRTFERHIARDKLVPIGKACEERITIIGICHCCCVPNTRLWYLALHRSGNYLCGKRMPEAVALLDKYKKRHLAECTGCRYYDADIH